MPSLTLTNAKTILYLLLPHVAGWFSSHKIHKMPIARLIHRLRFLMQKFNGGRYLGSLCSHGSCAMSTNPNNVHRPEFSSFKRCPQSFTRGHNHVAK